MWTVLQLRATESEHLEKRQALKKKKKVGREKRKGTKRRKRERWEQGQGI
jgi:hypothetical protein